MTKPILLLLLLPAASLAPAGEWQCRREYYLAEVRRAEAAADLDCARDADQLERERWRWNQSSAAILMPYRPRVVVPRGGPGAPRSGGPQVLKSKRTSPPSSFSRASNALPAFDAKPLSSGLLPFFNKAWAERTLIVLPAIVFQILNWHPDRQPLHP